ncbi:MAG TPA: aromatic ring-hydroxylating dioxygenase subunit alpha [Methylibium sp.]|uniref:aromatic ring-hydroxylating dioxygenase subunit alpha n=1 Tax=Methylibium sp. TaxID=2067992 RepID=UPI002DBCF9F4|nr:aromatic ring-hydroxylating dioxygenase subunit alpha [Methylibium sp.]HEU4460693.1 aromatic ring-hydroxylating dioxygenase subunit alpha [Methylibium sp.]
MFPKNAWYVACTPDEIATRPLGRTVCNERLVVFRGPEGKVAALEDWCPHRGAPLSLGAVVDGKLVCGYHGLEMGCDGKTVAMPGQRVRGFAPLRSYPAVERHGYVWVWPGDAAQADAAKLPHLPWADDPAWTFGGGMFHVRCDYRLMIDNLMDLTHEKYVHATSIGQPELDEIVPQSAVEGDTVVTRREIPGVKAPPFWAAAMRGNGLDDSATVDRWQRCRFVPPANVLIDVGVALAGQGGFDAPAAVKTSGIVVDLITPETETSIWYFWGLARNFKPEDAALTAQIREAQSKVFQEDLEMLESQQRNHSAQPERALLSLNTDYGGVQARKVVQRLVEQERAAR